MDERRQECILWYRLPEANGNDRTKNGFQGQKQKWFLLKLSAADEAVCLDRSDKPEFDRWRWVDYWRPVSEVVFFKRNVYSRALNELGQILFVVLVLLTGAAVARLHPEIGRARVQLTRVSSYAIGSLAAFWVFERVATF